MNGDDSAEEVLPPLLAIRGWTAEIDPGYLRFIDEMRATGTEVVDVFVPHGESKTFGEWADAVMVEALVHYSETSPLHILSYCGGGTLTTVGLRLLEQQGLQPAYLGFIDVRAGHPEFRLRMGFDSMYAVPWAQRIRHQLVRLTPPDRERPGAVAASLFRRAVRSTIELRSRGWRSRNRRSPLIHRQAELAARWEFDSIRTPAHLYNCADSVNRYWPGDPSLGRSSLLRGGFGVRFIGGDHHSCLQPPHSADLIAKITDDRRAVHSGTSILIPLE